MDEKCRAIRRVLVGITRDKAVACIHSFQLSPDEEAALLGEVRGKSIQQIAMERHVSPETVKRRRKSAFQKISSELGI